MTTTTDFFPLSEIISTLPATAGNSSQLGLSVFTIIVRSYQAKDHSVKPMHHNVLPTLSYEKHTCVSGVSWLSSAHWRRSHMKTERARPRHHSQLKYEHHSHTTVTHVHVQTLGTDTS